MNHASINVNIPTTPSYHTITQLFFLFFLFLKEKLLLHKAKTKHQQEQNRGRQGGHTNPKQKENNKTSQHITKLQLSNPSG